MIAYRKASYDDNQILTQLLHELYQDVPYEHLAEENCLHHDCEKQAFFLAYDGEEAVGVCHGSIRYEYVNGKEGEIWEDCGYLEAIYVRESHRMQGVATGLVALCEKWVHDNNCNEFLSDCLLDNSDSFKFHLKLGFVETERCIFFRKELT
ncbi:MAG: GNAT family N-acetyltransferase [Defluviitaleaceae bacterium]|nr:GNAT family N-acetyltransferase [Defluviitaleaceae bacterium]